MASNSITPDGDMLIVGSHDKLARERNSSPPADCDDACTHLADGDCDDGGEGSEYDICPFGSDCSDCGPRLALPPPTTPPPPPPPPPPGFTICDVEPSVCDGTFVSTELGPLPRRCYLNSIWFTINKCKLTGAIPPALGNLSQLEDIKLGKNELSGVIPPELGRLSRLKVLFLSNNAISGTIPQELGDISQLEQLSLEDNALSGTIPGNLANLASLRSLNFGINQLEYPRSSEARAEYNKATRMCRGGDISCYGIPPKSCTAFADARQSRFDPNECVVCDSSTTSIISFSIAVVVGITVLIAIFIHFVLRHPMAMKRWVSSAAILINHAQTASIIASMRLEWPQLPRAIASALKFDLIVLPSVSCLFAADQDPADLNGQEAGGHDALRPYTLLASSAVIASLLAPLLVKYLAAFYRRLAVVDTAELVLSMIYSFVFIFAWSLVLEYAANLLYLASARIGSAQLGAEAGTAAVLIVLLLLLLIRFTGNVIAFKRGVDQGVWQHPGSSSGFDNPSSLIAFISDVLFDATAQKTFNAARYGIVIAAIAVTLFFWFLQHRALPFAYRDQNALEWWLYLATTTLLFLALAYTLLPDLRMGVEVLITVVLLGSLIAGAIFSILELRKMRRALADVDLSEVLSAADCKIDGSLADRLRDGSVRLLRSRWLASPSSDALLGRDPAGAVIMRRRQDLPPEAFVPCDEAAAMLERGDRSVLALSHCWLTALHPDPHGTTLAAVRRFLSYDATAASGAAGDAEASDAGPFCGLSSAGDTGLFWDFCGLPQKGPNGEVRSEEDAAIFKRVLDDGIMGSFYASVTGTAILQQRDVVIPPGSSTGFGPGEYNSRPYEGEGGRGWCIFEQGVSMTVLAHLTAAERQAEEKGKALPRRFRRAQASRAKVYDIAGQAPVARECSLPPKKVLAEACRAIEKSRFTGKADMVTVLKMLARFEWTVHSTFEQALEDHAASGVTITRKELQEVMTAGNPAVQEAAASAPMQAV